MSKSFNNSKAKMKFKYPDQGLLQILILRSIYEKPLYGYSLIEKIEDITGGFMKIKSGTMYTTLRRMEKDKLVKSSWKKSEKGPSKRMYTLTKLGSKHLEAWLSTISKRLNIVENLVEFYKESFE